MALSDGSAVDDAQEHSRVEEAIHVRYSGVASFDVSTSPTVVVTKKSLAMSGRPVDRVPQGTAERRPADAMGAAYGVARVTGNVRSSAAPASGRPGSGGIPALTARAATKSGRGEASQSIHRSTRGAGSPG